MFMCFFVQYYKHELRIFFDVHTCIILNRIRQISNLYNLYSWLYYNIRLKDYKILCWNNRFQKGDRKLPFPVEAIPSWTLQWVLVGSRPLQQCWLNSCRRPSRGIACNWKSIMWHVGGSLRLSKCYLIRSQLSNHQIMELSRMVE